MEEKKKKEKQQREDSFFQPYLHFRAKRKPLFTPIRNKRGYKWVMKLERLVFALPCNYIKRFIVYGGVADSCNM